MSTSRLVFALALTFAAACSSNKDDGPPTTCGTYAAMEAKCNGGDGVRAIARTTCEDAQKDKATNAFSAMIALEADCAEKQTDCAAYAACVETAKAETTPPGMLGR